MSHVSTRGSLDRQHPRFSHERDYRYVVVLAVALYCDPGYTETAIQAAAGLAGNPNLSGRWRWDSTS